MSVSIRPFGKLADGRTVQRVTMKNRSGTALSILDLGATIQSLVYDGHDVVLGYDRIEGYENANGSYIGATVGRYANRIADGAFTLDGKDYTLVCNEKSHNVHLHGGAVGFDRKLWLVDVVSASDEPSVRFSMISPNGQEGYPGTLSLSVTFSLGEDDAVTLHYQAKTDKPTVLNLTNHTYFNLGGCTGGDVLDTLLRLDASHFTPIDERMLPTGEIRPVAGTALDFTQAKPIRDGALADDPQVRIAGGVDHNFVIDGEAGTLREAAVAYCPKTDIRMTCLTDQPGVQVYTGNFLDEAEGKQGVRWQKHYGFCLETQHYPDSVHQPSFPSVVLRPGETFDSRTQYAFGHGAID